MAHSHLSVLQGAGQALPVIRHRWQETHQNKMNMRHSISTIESLLDSQMLISSHIFASLHSRYFWYNYIPSACSLDCLNALKMHLIYDEESSTILIYLCCRDLLKLRPLSVRVNKTLWMRWARGIEPGCLVSRVLKTYCKGKICRSSTFQRKAYEVDGRKSLHCCVTPLILFRLSSSTIL